MYKLIVLSVLVAVAAAEPGVIHGAAGYSVGVPIAHTAPVVTAYAAPAHIAAAPVVHKTIVAPAAVSHSYRSDVISKPVISTYAAAPVVAAHAVHKPLVTSYAAPIVAKTIVGPAVYGSHIPAVHAW